MKKIILLLVIGLVALFVLIQLVPYGHNHTNPPVVQEPAWDSPETRELAKRACFDCHSNETVWPWYSNIAPISWLVVNDTLEGRSRLNFSAWGQQEVEVDEIGEVVMEGEMPPAKYLPTHPAARLSAAEREALARGLAATTANR
jgi:mono/diheme cytochrome c family protein